MEHLTINLNNKEELFNLMNQDLNYCQLAIYIGKIMKLIYHFNIISLTKYIINVINITVSVFEIKFISIQQNKVCSFHLS